MANEYRIDEMNGSRGRAIRHSKIQKRRNDMATRLKYAKSLWVSLLAIVLVATIACSSEEPAPAATNAAEIQSIVEAALKGAPGLSKADLEAAIKAQSAEQVTVADMKSAVDSAMAALPAPKIDTSAIRSLVEQAVAASVPEGTSPAEISRLVEAAVAAASKDAPTMGELEASIAKSLKDASADDLTAQDIQKIVNASVAALAASVADAASKAARAVAAAGAAAELPAVRTGFSRVEIPPLVFDASNLEFPLLPGMRPAADQKIVFPWAAKKNGILPWNEGSQSGRTTNLWTYMPLFQIDPNGSLAQGVALAYDVTDDGLSYIIHLDPEAIFHDGTPVTAADVKAAWEFASNPDYLPSWGGAADRVFKVIEGYPAVLDGSASEASGLEAIDDNTLRINLGTLDVLFPYKLGSTLAGIHKAHAQSLTDPDWDQHPIGVGPFAKTWDPASGGWLMFPQPNYWREPRGTVSIELIVVPDRQVQAIMYENEELDLWFPFPVSIYLDPSHQFNKDLRKYPAAAMWGFVMDTNKPPFDDLNVRKAFAHGVDSQLNWNTAFGIGTFWSTGILQKSLSCYTARTGYTYDPAKAKEFLAASKYGSAANLPSITISVFRPQLIQVVELMQEQLKDNLGVEVSIERREGGQKEGENVSMYRRSWGTGVPDPAPFMNTVAAGPTYTDIVHAVNPELDSLLAKANAMSLNNPGRCQAYLDVEEEFLNNYYIIPGFGEAGEQQMYAPWLRNWSVSWANHWISLPWWVVGNRDRDLYD